ncbi:MAG: HAMP domain-containing histidine kinase [Bacteroidales bacterium]|nr:HAMP domain-containing histidine kinase [Bacteroidales bacterium]
MLSKKFYFNIIVRIILILFTCIAIIPFIDNKEKLFTITSILLIFILQIYLLISYINRFNREVANFFAALKTNDASFAFHDKTFKYISDEFRNDINYVKRQLFNVTELKEIQQSYFKTLIENAQTGIITITKNGNIDIINAYALKVLNIKRIFNIQDLKSIHPGFYNILSGFTSIDKTIVIKGNSSIIPLSVRITEFKQKEQRFKLVSFQNIKLELEEKEIESWHKLIRVLTHEINNTISPITSLASSLEKLYTKESLNIKKEISENVIEKTQEGLHIISERGQGLMEFVSNYKDISSLKKMDFTKFKVAELFYNLELLLKAKLDSKNIELTIDIKPFDLELNADKKYIEQIFINLIKNAFDSISNSSGKIILSAYSNMDKVILEITDNGVGIPENILDQIFVPFFSTKEQGSGIGLSLAQQIVHLHGGNISVRSEPKIKTTFIISF